MPWKTSFSAIIGMALLMTWQGVSFAASPGKPEGAGVECVLRVDRTVYHPGEMIDLQGYVKNSGNAVVKLTTPDFARNYAMSHLHIRTPSGEEFSYEPYRGHPLQSSLLSSLPRGFTTELAPGQEHSAFRKDLGVTWDLTNWVSREHEHGPLSLREPGEYRFWFEYQLSKVPNAPQDAWMGTVTSNTLAISVAELRPDERREKPTAEQLATIEKLQSVAPTSIEGRDLLQQAMLRAENEGLAAHLVNLCLQDARRGEDFIVMVSLRACRDQVEGDRLQLGIDGPYLKTLALATIERLEHPPQDPNHLRLLRSPYALNATIAYLRFHPEDTASRKRLIEIAVQSAKLPPPGKLQPLPDGHAAMPGGHASVQPSESQSQGIYVPFAWSVLLELEVLHAGMTAEAAIEILGPPSRRTPDSLTWYLDSPRQVNPGLTAKIEDGKVKSFRRYSG